MRKKVPQPQILYDNKPQYTSEPYLTDEDPIPQPVRRGSQRRTAQTNSSAAHAPGELFQLMISILFVFTIFSSSFSSSSFVFENEATRRKSNAFLDVPGGNSYNSRTHDINGDDTVTLRTFSSSNKGLCFNRENVSSIDWSYKFSTGIVNRGDSFRRRRSRSASLIPPVSPMKAPDQLSSHSSAPTDSYLVAMLGAPGVGKCALLSQFRTSECINAYETGRGKLFVFASQISCHFVV